MLEWRLSLHKAIYCSLIACAALAGALRNLLAVAARYANLDIQMLPMASKMFPMASKMSQKLFYFARHFRAFR